MVLVYLTPMNMNYHHEENTRRRSAVLGFSISCVLIGVALQSVAPWYFLAPVGCACVMFVWMIAVGRASGMALSGGELRMHAGSWNQTIPVAEIERMDVKSWMDGAPDVSLVLTDGRKIDIPAYCIGSVKDLSSAMAARGILVQQT